MGSIMGLPKLLTQLNPALTTGIGGGLGAGLGGIAADQDDKLAGILGGAGIGAGSIYGFLSGKQYANKAEQAAQQSISKLEDKLYNKIRKSFMPALAKAFPTASPNVLKVESDLLINPNYALQRRILTPELDKVIRGGHDNINRVSRHIAHLNKKLLAKKLPLKGGIAGLALGAGIPAGLYGLYKALSGKENN